jgi:hypothetical protein
VIFRTVLTFNEHCESLERSHPFNNGSLNYNCRGGRPFEVQFELTLMRSD